jgi:pseudouridine kinase
MSGKRRWTNGRLGACPKDCEPQHIVQAMNITCIGGLNWDKKLRLLAPLVLGTSNPAAQQAAHAGGVAFNVARHLAGFQGLSVRLLSLCGDDAVGQALQAAVGRAGVQWQGVVCAGSASGQYSAVLDAQGDLVLALAEMAVFEHLPSTFWNALTQQLTNSDALVLDLNFALDDTARICQAAQALSLPLALVAVSAPKMAHLPTDLRAVDLLVLNTDELQALGTQPLDVRDVWHSLQQRGLRALVVTQGADGLTLCQPQGLVHLSAPQRIEAVLDVTGAGDAFAAHTLAALWQQRLPLQQALALGQRAAARVLLSLDNA